MRSTNPTMPSVSPVKARRSALSAVPPFLLLLPLLVRDASAAAASAAFVPTRTSRGAPAASPSRREAPAGPRRRRGGAPRSSSSDPLGEWILSEVGSLSAPEDDHRGRARPPANDGRFLDSPAAMAFPVVGASSSTRREWLGAAASSAAALAGASAWSFRPGSAAAAAAEAAAPAAPPPPPTFPSSAALCDPSISTFRNPTTGRIVHILGTAHISTDSARLAGRVVREVRPDAVFVELDRKRIARALPSGDDDAPSGGGPGAGEKISVGLAARGAPGAGDGVGDSAATAADGQPEAAALQQPSRRGAFGNPIQQAKDRVMSASTRAVGDAIKGMYSKLGEQGFNPGEEFILAIREAMAVNAAVVLGDRDVDVTLRRLTEALSRTDLKKLLSSDSELERSLKNVMPEEMRTSMEGNANKMTKDQLTAYVETVKARENVRAVMTQLKLYAPELFQAMVVERDEYMAKGLDSLDKFGTTVAVMGIAHMDGVEGSLRERGWEPVSVPCPAR